MPNLFSNRKDRSEQLEPYVRSSLTLQLSRTESIASDATMPNNPGAGRTLGLLFDAAGKKIEGFLNKRAIRRGLTPRAILEEIRTIRGNVFRGFMRRAPNDKEHILLENLCRKLLKHCRSHVLETQLEALEAITTLAIEDLYVRQMLAGVLHHKYLIPEYKEQELCIHSFRALISVKENEVYDFFEYIKNRDHLLKRRSDDPRGCHLLNRLESFLRNPDVSFLLQRLIEWECTFEEEIFNTYIRVASTKPHVVEWETLRGCISRFKSHIRTFSIDDIMRLASYFPILHMYQSRQGQVTHSDPSKDGSLILEEFATRESSLPVLGFLAYLCGSEDLATQLQFLRDLDEAKRRLFQGTVFNEIHIALAHACHDDDDLNLTRIACIETAAIVLFRYHTCGYPDQQALAKEAITLSMKSSRYFKVALAAACQRNDVCSADMPLFMLLERIPFEWRSCHYVHSGMDRRLFKRNIEVEPAGEDMEMCEDDVLYNETSWGDRIEITCWLEVRGDEHPLNVTGHFPILAGFDTSGKQLYVARVDLTYKSIYSYVSDGARSLPIYDRFGEVRVFDRFYVLVLRRDPCSFGVTNIPGDVKLQTGPVFWVRGEDEERNKGLRWRGWRFWSWKSQLGADDLADCVVKTFGHLKPREIGEEDGFKNVTESDSEEIADMGSNENTWEGLELEESVADSDADYEQGILEIQGEGSEDSDKLEGHPRLIEDEQRQLEEEKQALERRIERIEERQRELEALRPSMALKGSRGK